MKKFWLLHISSYLLTSQLVLVLFCELSKNLSPIVSVFTNTLDMEITKKVVCKDWHCGQHGKTTLFTLSFVSLRERHSPYRSKKSTHFSFFFSLNIMSHLQSINVLTRRPIKVWMYSLYVFMFRGNMQDIRWKTVTWQSTVTLRINGICEVMHRKYPYCVCICDRPFNNPIFEDFASVHECTTTIKGNQNKVTSIGQWVLNDSRLTIIHEKVLYVCHYYVVVKLKA